MCVCVCVATHVSGYVETKGQHEGSLFNVSPSLFFFFFETKSFSEPEANRFALMVGQ